MRRELEDTVERKAAALEENIAPVPAIILDDVMCLGLHPQVERDEGDAPNPPANTASV